MQIWGTGVRVEVVLRTLGLANAADTMVGSATVRGVSGGERKRVTSAEMLVGPKVCCQMEILQKPWKAPCLSLSHYHSYPVLLYVCTNTAEIAVCGCLRSHGAGLHMC